tara:strand:+ start:620 stop:1786 length:1167 start_codon:yes stop_codon:yes gene_type:complete
MKIYLARRKSKKSKRIYRLHIRKVNAYGVNNYISLNLYEYISPRNSLERLHNSDVARQCEKAILQAKIDALDNVEDKTPLLFKWIDEVVVPRLQNPLKRLLNFLDSDIKKKSIKEVAEPKYFFYIKSLFQNEIEEKKYRGRVGHKGRGKRIMTAQSYINYWSSLRACIKKAYPQHIDTFPKDIGHLKTNEKLGKSDIFYTNEEIKRLWETPVFDERNYYKNIKGTIGVKEACFFSLYTGLRISDIINLEWGNIKKNANGVYYFDIIMVKTNIRLRNSFPQFARDLIGERKSKREKVFSGLQGSSYKNSYREFTYNRWKAWSQRAKIPKGKTIHTFRHTYGNNLYKACGNLYEVSKALGHKSIKTTEEFYAPKNNFEMNGNLMDGLYNL